MPKQEDVKVVAPRNDPSPLEPYAKSKALELQGRDPGFAYEWFRRDQLADKLRPHEIGNQFTGFLMVDPWEVVDTSQGVTQGRLSDAAGKATDTVMTNGELILCRTPKANHAKYAVIERKQDQIIDRRLSGGEAVALGGGTSFKTRTAGGRASLDASPNDVLQGV